MDEEETIMKTMATQKIIWDNAKKKSAFLKRRVRISFWEYVNTLLAMDNKSGFFESQVFEKNKEGKITVRADKIVHLKPFKLKPKEEENAEGSEVRAEPQADKR